MLVLPREVKLRKSSDGSDYSCQAVLLTHEMAYNYIDCVWWRDIPQELRDKCSDGTWNWKELVEELESASAANSSIAIVDGNVVHGAMIYGVNGSAVLSEGGAVAVHLVATSPSCRKKGSKRQEITGCGEQLIALAAASSVSMNFGGIVNLYSKLDAEDFYLRLGMIATGKCDQDGLRQFELPAEQAVLLVKKHLRF